MSSLEQARASDSSKATSFSTLFFKPYAENIREKLEQSSLNEGEINVAVSVYVRDFAVCLVERIWEWDDPISQFYISEVVLGLDYGDIGVRPESIAEIELLDWIKKVEKLVVPCEDYVKSTWEKVVSAASAT